MVYRYLLKRQYILSVDIKNAIIEWVFGLNWIGNMPYAIVKSLPDAFKFIEDEYNSAMERINNLTAELGQPKAFKNYDEALRPVQKFFYMDNVEKEFKYASTIDAMDAVVARIRGYVDAATSACDVVDIHNSNIFAHNRELRKRITEFMTTCGIPEKRSMPDPKSRARYPKKITVDAGYVDDMKRYVPTQIPTSRVNLNSVMTYVNTVYEKKKKEIEAKEQEIEREKAEKEKTFLITSMLIKYGFGSDKNEYDILDAILSKNKYLRLAHYLQLNRLDWSDGYEYARTGIDSFKVETDQDKEIFECVYARAYDDDDCPDGRVFRDCEWSYDRLFGMVAETEKELYDDYQRIIQYTSKYN